MNELGLAPQALKADWRCAERDPYKRIPVLEKREAFTSAFKMLAERLALRSKFLGQYERQVAGNWDDKPDKRTRAAKKLIYDTCRHALGRGAARSSKRLDWRTLHQQMDKGCYSDGFADVALDAAYHSATDQLQRLDAAREVVVADLQEVVRLRHEKAAHPNVFKVKRYPAGDARAERRAMRNESGEAMAVYRQLRVLQVGR
jgi:hypothetical protein